jgi:peroxiredoxin
MSPRSILIAAAIGILAFPARAQETPKTPPRGSRETSPSTGSPRPFRGINSRVHLGERAPGFELEGSQGRTVRLFSLRGDWVILAFGDRYRDIAPLQSIQAETRTLGARLVGVCHEKVQTLSKRAAQDSISFLMLADRTGEISALYGLYNRSRSETQPGFVVVDRAGFVRLAVLGQQLPPADVVHLTRLVVAGQQ